MALAFAGLGRSFIKTGDLSHASDAAAQSVRRYFDVSGIGPKIMPEYFMPAFILDRLGDKLSAMLETNFRTLVEWNAGVRHFMGAHQPPRGVRLLR